MLPPGWRNASIWAVAGTYDVDATIQQNDLGVPAGTKTADVKAKDGRATEWKGTEKVKVQNCSFLTFVNYTLVGKLR